MMTHDDTSMSSQIHDATHSSLLFSDPWWHPLISSLLGSMMSSSHLISSRIHDDILSSHLFSDPWWHPLISFLLGSMMTSSHLISSWIHDDILSSHLFSDPWCHTKPCVYLCICCQQQHFKFTGTLLKLFYHNWKSDYSFREQLKTPIST